MSVEIECKITASMSLNILNCVLPPGTTVNITGSSDGGQVPTEFYVFWTHGSSTYDRVVCSDVGAPIAVIIVVTTALLLSLVLMVLHLVAYYTKTTLWVGVNPRFAEQQRRHEYFDGLGPGRRLGTPPIELLQDEQLNREVHAALFELEIE